MRTCKKCHVEIMDDTHTCPLCKSVLIEVEGQHSDLIANGYPDLAFTSDGFHLLNRIMVFLSIMITLTSIVVNYAFYSGVLWSVISIAIVLYSWTIVRHAIINSFQLASKIMVQCISAAVIVVCIDYVIGYRGWSINYVVPQISIAANISVFVLLIISKLDWKRFVLQILAMGFLGLIPMLLLVFGLVEHPLMSYIASGISVVIVLFTLVFGDKSVKTEIIRRFHI